MDLGFRFVAWSPLDGFVQGEVVWTGSMPVNPESDVEMPSSLLHGMGQSPAKALGPGGSRATRGSGLVSQTAMRA